MAVKRKVCVQCHAFVEGSKCPVCGGTQFSTEWRGRVFILRRESRVAAFMGISQEGEYAIRIR